MSNIIQQTPLFNNPVSEPLPERLAESIRQAVASGRLHPGQKLPSEPDFAGQLGVSRTTLRDAVRILVSEGLLDRRRGVGTFIVDSPLVNIEGGLETLVGTTELIRDKGYTPGTSLTERELVAASDRLAQALEVPTGTTLVHFSRTRTANGVPVIQCEEYVAAAVFEAGRVADSQGDWSFYQLLDDIELGVASAVCKVTPVVADKRLAHLLDVSVNHPLLLLSQTHYTSDHRPILYCQNYHNSSIIEFHIIRRRQ